MKHADVIVVGAGPAGIAAATAAARHGRSVLLVDDNPGAGGQIWRGGIENFDKAGEKRDDPAKTKALKGLVSSGATLLSGFRVFDAPGPSELRAIGETSEGTEVVTLRYDRLILATGARERFLPFPGWTLPGVFGAGGLQALVKGGFAVEGKRVVVAGSGPLLLAVAAHLHEYKASIACIAEQATTSQLAPFASSLLSYPSKVWQGISYRATLYKTPYRTGSWPISAMPNEATGLLKSVQLTNGNKTWQEPCDMLACGFHLVPNTELASLLNCKLQVGFVAVDEQQRTSVENVYCAGEPTGIAGLDAALIQGEIAGLVSAGQSASHLHSRNLAERRFGARLEAAFRLRPELRLLPALETIVCRCEDVTYEDLAARSSWTDAKLQTRCGMGPCQGRICGPATQTLFGWTPKSVRPPLFPVPVSAFCVHDSQQTVSEEIA
ncbi:MAG TPA: FAD-dependent oxidoreductase [Edaphobacter sp.]|jgi:NADPH-dependent 2,4-dienoyl-CoA reductase/sulfur reductase-like enzyme|nr:FAD-dependent oxidoreductase [Edaphobacter sp.]